MGMLIDRVSKLSDDLLLHILSSLKCYKSAVVCSVLSKRWVSLYTQLPCLYFSQDDDEAGAWKFVKMVTNALLRHKGDLVTLSISYGDLGLGLDDWVDYAASHNVQKLCLYAPGGYLDERATLASLFSCTALMSLELCCMHVKNRVRRYNPTTPSPEFSFLRSCHLDEMDDKVLGLLLGKCPVLETLKLSDFEVSSKFVEVSSESLRVLFIEVGEGEEKNFELKFQCPHLEEMRISTCIPFNLKLECNNKVATTLRKSFGFHWQYPDEADSLVYDYNTAINMSWDDGKLSNLKTLELFDLVISVTTVWNMLMHLPLLKSVSLGNCAFLQDMDLTSEQIVEAAIEVNFREAHLKLQQKTAGDLLLLRLLNNKCPMLHTMVVTLEGQILWNDEACLKVLKELFTLNCSRKRACLKEIEKMGSVVQAVIEVTTVSGPDAALQFAASLISV